MNRLIVVVTTVLLLVGCGAAGNTRTSATTRARRATARGWSGLGARRVDWEAANPRGTETCPQTKCFGRWVEGTPGEPRYEYAVVETTPEGRVDGYEQALGGGEVTPAEAEHLVLSKLPPDTRVLDTFVEHGEYGSCKIIKVQSRSLGRWFGSPNVDDASGVMNIDIHGVASNGESTFPKNLGIALVSIAPMPRGAGC